MHDLIIIGGGPAGISAGVYASRKQLKTVLIAEDMGGQSAVSSEIQNWIGTPAISGMDLAATMTKHLDAYKGDFVKIVEARATKIEKVEGGFKVSYGTDKSETAKAILIASGGHRRELEVPGAKEFDQKGLTYCASCDGPLFADQDVIVIGGGNAAFETAAQLLAYAKSVTLFNRSNELRADPATIEAVTKHPNMKVVLNADPVEVKGDKFVNAFVYTDKTTDERKEIPVTGIFVEIGMLPNTDYAEGIVPLDAYKRVIVDPRNQRTSVPGIWAAGDCTDELYHQNNIAAGDGVKALEDIYATLKAR